MTVNKDGKLYNIPVQCERKKRKTIVLRIYPKTARILFSMPLKTPPDYARSFFESKKSWLLNALRQILPVQSQKEYIAGDKIYYLGQQLTLSFVEGLKNYSYRDNENLILAAKEELLLKQKQILIEKALLKGFTEIIEDSLYRMVKIYQPFLPLNSLPKLKVRKMTSKWGICRPFKQEITLSKRLVHVPLALIDYVMAHELCHFKHLDHSQAFWQLLQKGMPDCKARRKALNEMHLYIDL